MGPTGDSGHLSNNPEKPQETGSDTDYDLPSPPHVSVFSKEHNKGRKIEQLQAAKQQVEELEKELVQLQVEGKKSNLPVKNWSPTIKKKINLLRGKISRKKKSIGHGIKQNVDVKIHPALSKQDEQKKSAFGKNTFDMDKAIEVLEAKECLSLCERTELKKLKERRKKQRQRQNESEYQRLKRLQQDKENKEETRRWESESERLERLQKDKENKEETRRWETESQRLDRLQKVKENTEEKRRWESESQRLERLQKKKENMEETRRRESSAEKKKRNRKESDKRMYKRRAGTKITRLGNFRKQVRYGPVYPCITCHQLMFRHQVVEFNEDVKMLLDAKCSDRLADNTISCTPESFFMTITEEKIGSKEDECDLITMVSGGSENERRCFLCKVCYSHLKKGVLPPKAAANCLKAVDVPEDVKLSSYLEEALLARTLLFMKIFSLKSSLMPAIKDKCVVIPIDCVDVLNTVQSLPRLPSESGIIDIQWKRRMGQKNAHLQAKVEPARIFRALEFLRASGNEHYVDTNSREEYEARCLAEDPDGYDLIFGNDETEEQGGQGSLRVTFLPDGTAETILELAPFCELQHEQVNRRL